MNSYIEEGIMTEQEINYRFDQIQERVDQINAAASNIETNTLQPLEALLSNINNSWDGINSDDYLRKCQKEYDKVQSTVNTMKSVAAEILQIAQNAKDADMRALRIVQSITSIFEH